MMKVLDRVCAGQNKRIEINIQENQENIDLHIISNHSHPLQKILK